MWMRAGRRGHQQSQSINMNHSAQAMEYAMQQVRDNQVSRKQRAEKLSNWEPGNTDCAKKIYENETKQTNTEEEESPP